MERKANNNQQNDTRTQEDQDLPGYPHYPAEDDIMNPQHGFKKIAADEELANSNRLSGMAINDRANSDDTIEPLDDDDDVKIVSGTDANVTAEDLLILGDKETDQDLGEDELVGNARVDELEEESDLDIPEAQMSDEEALGQDDEENNYYSLGGDRHESLEEDPNTQE